MNQSNACLPSPEKPCCSPANTGSERHPQAESKPDVSCCAAASSADCGSPEDLDNRPGYQLWPFVCAWQEGPQGSIPRVTTSLTAADILGRWKMRWGLGRARYRIAAGVYAVGCPSELSPVLVTANYKMTFDILRRDLHGRDAWLLVLDTRGVNVWCAAGKGTFSTAEIITQVRKAALDKLVSHRSLILPQLGAPGVTAHEVKKACGFKVVYGPVRSCDLAAFLDNEHVATEEMRQVTFALADRLVLTPVELVNSWRQVLWSMLVLFSLGGLGPQIFSLTAAWQRGSAAVLFALTALVTGAVLVPIFLPWLPGRAFAVKGAIAGLAVSCLDLLVFHASFGWLAALALLIAVPAISSWYAMNFTGSSTFTSPSGVEKEMRQAIPAQATGLLVGGLCWIASAF